MTSYTTSQGRQVEHCHIVPCFPRELTQGEKNYIRQLLSREHPNVGVAAEATRAYNCHGYAHAQSHGWFNDPTPFIADDYLQQTVAQPFVGDVVVYMSNGIHTHSAVVTAVSSSSISELRSKWGQFPLVIHTLTDVPAEYGTAVYLLRRRPGAIVRDVDGDAEKAREAVRQALANLQRPEVYSKLLLASTPTVVRAIVADLPGVEDIIRIGQVAHPEVVKFFEDAAREENDAVCAIALFLIERMRIEQAAISIARYLSAGTVGMLTRDLAVQALLAATGTDIGEEPAQAVAEREMRRLLGDR
jgi:hypothetical protein